MVEALINAKVELDFEEPVPASTVLDGKIDFGELAESLVIDATANLDLVLPVYFPVKSLPLGGSILDRDGDGHQDNSIVIDVDGSANNNDGFSIWRLCHKGA